MIASSSGSPRKSSSGSPRKGLRPHSPRRHVGVTTARVLRLALLVVVLLWVGLLASFSQGIASLGDHPHLHQGDALQRPRTLSIHSLQQQQQERLRQRSISFRGGLWNTTSTTTTTTMEKTEPDSPLSPLIHIVYTRFMQDQPTLISLGFARLKLLEEFFLGSLGQQTTDNFLVVIRTDPALDKKVQEPLIDLLHKASIPRWILLPTNDNPPKSQQNDLVKTLTARTGRRKILREADRKSVV